MINAIKPIRILLAAPTALVAYGVHAAEPPQVVEAPSELNTPKEVSDATERFRDEPLIDLEPGFGSAWLSAALRWQHRDTTSGGAVLLTLGIPLERLAIRRTTAVAGPNVLAEGPAKIPTRTNKPGAMPARAVPGVDGKLARACVRAAWKAYGIAADDDLERLASRARWSATLPEVRLRASQGWDDSWRYTPTDSDPNRTQQGTGTSRWMEGRFTWRLDRLVFADEELAVERIRQHRAELRTKLAGQVLTALFDWHRAAAMIGDATLEEEQRSAAMFRMAEAEALLDVLTGGWFSAKQAIGE